MPAKAAPKKPPETPPNMVQVSGTQEQFQAAGEALASKLGWEGEPDWETNGISVQDAWAFIVKSLHEHFQAGAHGADQPDTQLFFDHLGLESAEDRAAATEALDKAFEEGDGAPVALVAKTIAPAGAALTLPLSEAKSKAGK